MELKLCAIRPRSPSYCEVLDMSYTNCESTKCLKTTVAELFCEITYSNPARLRTRLLNSSCSHTVSRKLKITTASNTARVLLKFICNKHTETRSFPRGTNHGEVLMRATMDANDHDLSTFPSNLRNRRILVCSESFGPINGVSRTTLMIVNHLRSHGALVSVVAPYNHTKVNIFLPVDAVEDQYSYCSEVRLVGYPLPLNPELSVAYPVRLSAIYRKTFGGPPDLIYLASPASLGFQVLLQLRQKSIEAQVPLLCNFQTDLAGYYEILFPIPLGRIASGIFTTIEGYLFRHPSVKTVFYPSLFARRYLEDVANVQSDKLEVLRRGVNTVGFNPDKRNIELRRAWAPDGELILLTCSRLAGEKGYAFLAQVAAELAKADLDFKLVIVGGNQNIIVEQQIKGMFEPLVCDGKVIFSGFKMGENLMTHYASADIFLHCSITETFGLVVLEAMASGVPVIARDEGGPSDTIDHGRTGYLVPPNDLEGYVQRVLELGRDRELMRQFGKASRAQALLATWEMIGNRVAWKMMDAIEERAKTTERREHDDATAPQHTMCMTGILSTSSAVQTMVVSWIVDAKIFLSLIAIVGCWGGIGLCLGMINVAHWVRTRAARAQSCEVN
ncbi:glycosyltransferase family 4 protein [Xylariaceae sp. AK1471]|nr:glycosyltransferase family 4 protein [Xylariaceae sp. AK1471]